MAKPFYITTPIYYVNDRPHIGHAYTTIAGDLLARFHRLAGREAFFLTGTDEHGSKIAEAAAAAGVEPQAFCDTIVQQYIKTWKKLDIANDGFLRTTSEKHFRGVEKILNAMREARTDDGREVVYSDYYEGLYCTGCEKFLTEKELVDGLCPDHKRAPEKLKEKNYFFRLSAFLPRIKAMIESGELLILPEERRREVLGLIDQDVPDFSLSRERVKWGIPLSFDESQVAYVWVDALSNYITAMGYADDQQTFDHWWNQGEVVHLMAKDILKFHCLFWPAMLLAAGVKLPDTLFLHGYFTIDGEKMSKSLGNQIDPGDMVDEYGVDAARYLLLTQYPFGVDGDVQAKRFVTQYNSDLANDLGNLVSRVCKMVMTGFDGKLPEAYDDIEEQDELIAMTEKLADAAYEHVCHFRIHNAIGEALSVIRATNKFFNDRAPWKLKSPEDRPRFGGILNACCEVLRVVSVILYPVMPGKMREMRKTLSLDDTGLDLEAARSFHGLKPGITLQFDQPLFPRLEKKKPKADPATEKKGGGGKKADKESGAGLIDFSEFGKVKLCVAEILEAEKVEGADKLLKLQIDLGTEKRQIVAGIAQHYRPEQLIGRKVVVVANLKPATIRGVQSNGMLLAAKADSKLCFVTPESDMPSGSDIS